MAHHDGIYLSMAQFLSHDSKQPTWVRLLVFGTAFASILVLANLVMAVGRFIKRQRMLAAVPAAPGGDFVLGHVIPLLNAPRHGKGAWDLMEDWVNAKGRLVRFRILGTHGVVVSDPVAVKRIFQTKFKVYAKDLNMSYHPFLPILGTGLVTADGDLWQKQRLLIGPALRIDILDDIVGIAKRATDRFSAKLQQYKGTGQPIHVEEEFRLLTLQVIGEAILSLPAEECDRVSLADCLADRCSSCTSTQATAHRRVGHSQSSRKDTSSMHGNTQLCPAVISCPCSLLLPSSWHGKPPSSQQLQLELLHVHVIGKHCGSW
jgi:hypothetical protein